MYEAYVKPGATYQSVAQDLGLSYGQVRWALEQYRAEHGIRGRFKDYAARVSGESARPVVLNTKPQEVRAMGPTGHRYNSGYLPALPPNVERAPDVPMRSAVFDIETSDFSATGLRGFLICCSILPLDTKEIITYAIRYEERAGDDRELVREVIAELSKFDLLIGHYITGFDLPWLYTRADVHGLPPMRAWLAFDTYYAARAQKLKTVRKSLAFLVDHFRLEGLKTAVYPRLWEEVRSNDQDIFSYARHEIVYHCEHDVLANYELFKRLMPRAWAMKSNPFKLTYWAGAAAYAAPDEEAEELGEDGFEAILDAAN